MDKTYLTIDPGLKHTAAVIVKLTKDAKSGEEKASVLWSRVANLSGDVNPDVQRVYIFFTSIIQACKDFSAESVLIEFQPPINIRSNPAIVRWNSWIEGYGVAVFPNFKYVHPSGLKSHFKIATRNYARNKRASLCLARRYLDNPRSIQTDHEADCILMAVYNFQKETCQGKK